MIKNLKGLRSNAPLQPVKPLPNAKLPFGKQNAARQSSEDMDFDDWSENSGVHGGNGFKPNAVQKGFFGGTKPQQNRPVQYNNGYYDDDFEESDEMEALPFNAGRQQLAAPYGANAGGYGRLQHQQSDDMDFDDSNDFDEDVSNGQESGDDFGDVQLNVRKFKSSAKKNFDKKESRPVKFDNITDESGFNFDDDEKSDVNAQLQTKQVGKQLNFNAPTDKKALNRDAYRGDTGAQTTKVQGIGQPSQSNNKNVLGVKPSKRDMSSAEQFEDNFSDDFTQNVASVDNTQNNIQEKSSFGAHKSDVETFKSDFDDFKESFNVDISNFDNAPVDSKPKKQPEQKKPVQTAQPTQPAQKVQQVQQVQQPARGNYNDIDAAILADRNVENKYLSGKLEENDAYTSKIKDFMQQKTLEHEKLKARYELLLKEKVKLDDAHLENRQVLEAQNIELEKVSAENDAKQLVIDELTEKLSARTEELKGKTKLLQERENLFGNSLNEKKLHTNLINMSRDLELAKVRIADFTEAVQRYEQRIVDLEDELRGSPAAIRTKAVMQQRIEKLLKLLADNNIAVDASAVDAGDLNEDMVYQEMILNGYIKDNKKLIDENKFLKEKLFAHKIEESKSNFDSPAARVKELEESVKRLQDELVKKDEGFKKQAQRFDKADEILSERDRQLEALQQQHSAEVKKAEKEKKELRKEQKSLFEKIKELKAQVERAEEQLAKTKADAKRSQSKADDKPKLQRNIFSHSDQDFKQDIVSMLNNINQENKQVRSELRGLKDTWEFKGKMNEDVRVSDIPAPRSSNDLNGTHTKFASPDVERLKAQLHEMRALNNALEDRVMELEQQLGDKAKELKKSEFLSKKWYDERTKLLEIIKNMPKTARDVDFAVLEQKLINLEKEQKLKALELQTALKTFNKNDLSESTDTIRKEQLVDWQAERTKLLHIIKQKNDQIGKFKCQMEAIVAEVKKSKAAQI